MMSSTLEDDAVSSGRLSDLERFSASMALPARGEIGRTEAADTPPHDGSGQVDGHDPLRLEDVAEADDPSRSEQNSTPGFATIIERMDRRSREAVAMVRLLDQNRQVLDAAEMARDAAYAELARTVPVVEQTALRLADALDATRDGETGLELDALFTQNGEALADLEKTAVALSTHFLRCRTAWDQYVRSLDSAEQLRTNGRTF